MKSTSAARTRNLLIVFLALAGTLQACANLRPDYETPSVAVNSFRALPSDGTFPNFEIGLHIINPNRTALELKGISYTISLAGHEIIKGVSNQLPRIDAYGEGDVTLIAAANLFAGVGLLTDLMRGSQDSLDYEFEAKLDVGAFMPAIRVRESGQVSMRPSSGS